MQWQAVLDRADLKLEVLIEVLREAHQKFTVKAYGPCLESKNSSSCGSIG
ncbi:hypothetical protein [Prochlorococcus marinus]|nr:hypothetical protein [Prochlorococcus marinus]KZR77875.1 hypothetical protein PMIT1320_00262 [Prochlorococcus marinus str. MIT 1320]